MSAGLTLRLAYPVGACISSWAAGLGTRPQTALSLGSSLRSSHIATVTWPNPTDCTAFTQGGSELAGGAQGVKVALDTFSIGIKNRKHFLGKRKSKK
jgi:hypothetical protein